MLRLFQALCTSPDGTLARDEIPAKVYQIDDFDSRSARYVQAVHANAAKLVSRARILATMHFGKSVGPGVEWLAYDHGRKTWSLYRLREEYFRTPPPEPVVDVPETRGE